jgi:hypothetical protein
VDLSLSPIDMNCRKSGIYKGFKRFSAISRMCPFTTGQGIKLTGFDSPVVFGQFDIQPRHCVTVDAVIVIVVPAIGDRSERLGILGIETVHEIDVESPIEAATLLGHFLGIQPRLVILDTAVVIVEQSVGLTVPTELSPAADVDRTIAGSQKFIDKSEWLAQAACRGKTSKI